MKKIRSVLIAILFIAGFYSQAQEDKYESTFNLNHHLESVKTSSQNGQGLDHSLKSITDWGNVPQDNWSFVFGGSGDDFATSSDIDASNNIYLAGKYSGQINFGNGTHESTGTTEAFLVKYDAQGDLLWEFVFPAQEYFESSINDVTIGNDGNIYVTGHYTGELSIDDITLPAVNTFQLFYAKFSPEGNLLNAAYHSNSPFEIGLCVGADNSGNVYITATTSSSTSSRHESWWLKFNSNAQLIDEVFFDESLNDFVVNNDYIIYSGVNQSSCDGMLDENVPLPLYSPYNDVFIARSDLNGAFEWAVVPEHTEYGTGDSMDGTIKLDNSGNIYMAGVNRGSINFGEMSVMGDGFFLSKFNSEGTCLWITNNSFLGSKPKIGLDNESNVYLTYSSFLYKYSSTGSFISELGLGYIVSNHSTGSDGASVVAMKYNGQINLSKIESNFSYLWNKNLLGNSATSSIIGSVSDAEGNSYIFAKTSGSIEFLNTEVSSGLFLCKINSKGELAWLKQFPNVSIEYFLGSNIALNKESETVAITGSWYNEPITFDGNTWITPSWNGSTFIASYTLSGDYVSSKTFDFYSNIHSVDIDWNGNIVFGGVFNTENITIDDVTVTNPGQTTGFVAKFNNSGVLQFAKVFGGDDMDWDTYVSTDSAGNIFVSGESYSQNLNIGSDYSTQLNEGDGNIVLAKLNPSGNVEWCKSFGGTTTNSDYTCWPTNIKATPDGNCYVKGWHGDGVYFDNTVLNSPNGNYSKFIAKVNNLGEVAWVNSITETNYGYDYNQFSIDDEENVYLGYSAMGNLSFGDDFDYEPTTSGDLYVVKYNSSGSLEWVKFIPGGNFSYNQIGSVNALSNDKVIVTGNFTKYINIAGVDYKTTTKNGFVYYLGDDFNGIMQPSDVVADFLIYPNPTAGQVFVSCVDKIQTIDIIDLQGSLIIKLDNIDSMETTVDIARENLPAGAYFMRITTIKGESMYNKMIFK